MTPARRITRSNDMGAFSHHANLLIGGNEVRRRLVSSLETGGKIKIRGNQDFIDREYGVFTVDEARELKALAGTRPVKGKAEKIFVLKMDGITTEAQNALLKLLEEPPEYARFFLIVPSTHLLLPTVKSRLFALDPAPGRSGGAGDSGGMAALAAAFLKAGAAERLDAIKALTDDVSKEKKTKRDVIGFLDGLEAAVRAKGVRDNAAALEAMELARKYADDRAPSLKMLLEYAAMNIR